MWTLAHKEVTLLSGCWTYAKTDAGVVLKALKFTFSEISHRITFPFRKRIAMSCNHALQVKKCKL